MNEGENNGRTGPDARQVPVPGDWLESVFTSNVAHARSTERAHRLDRGLGVLALVFTTITGTTLFTTLQNSPSAATRTAIAVFAALSALVVAINTFFGFSGQAESHHKADASYGQLKHELQEVVASDGHMTRRQLDDFRARWDRVSAAAPTLAPGEWAKANQWVRSRLHSN
ncbi:MAG TPA: SLATT domain-containing protein [Solirubrobacter sp.]